MTAIEYLDRPASGWFVLAVMRRVKRKWDWVAPMVDVDPDDATNPFRHVRRERGLLIPGKHRNLDAAWEAFENMDVREEQARKRRAAFAVVPKG